MYQVAIEESEGGDAWFSGILLVVIALVVSSFQIDWAYAQQNNFTCDIVTEIPQAECKALVALYNSTDGPHWHNNSDWLFTSTPCSWYGITCDARRHVKKLELRDNLLSGNIPPELGNLIGLQELDLGGVIVLDRTRSSGLTGHIPPELGNLTNLVRLDLSYNKLTGSIPSELGNLAKLQTLSLSYNRLSGPIPPGLDNLANLKALHLKGNYYLSRSSKFGCDAISEISQEECASLVPLHRNMHNPTNWDWLLTNRPCSWIGVTCEAGRVVAINFSDMQHYLVVLFGNIPPELGGLLYLESLQLGGNQLTGSIPAELGRLANLRDLHLGYNNLSGSIPPEIGNLAKLGHLNLSNNQLSGSIPASLGHLVNLRSLELSVNRLSGIIPPELGNLDRLEYLNLSSNQLRGSIPPELYDMSSLKTIYLRHNEQLTAKLPEEELDPRTSNTGFPPGESETDGTAHLFSLLSVLLLSGALLLGALFMVFRYQKRRERR